MTEDALADFATWIEPVSAFQVQYSLPVFHEIDNEVVEGYRRIPHGGIEVGGLLFGHRLPGGVRIEAYRPIECEHALGPSFKLSDRDLTTLRDQIARAGTDPELGGLETLGWFIAHTRGPLELTTTEAGLFDELLPGPGRLTLLVKPEKFKPTLFAFLVRAATGAVSGGGTNRAFILPLPGKTAQPLQPVPAPSSPPSLPSEQNVPVEETEAAPIPLQQAWPLPPPTIPVPLKQEPEPYRHTFGEPQTEFPPVAPPSQTPVALPLQTAPLNVPVRPSPSPSALRQSPAEPLQPPPAPLPPPAAPLQNPVQTERSEMPRANAIPQPVPAFDPPRRPPFPSAPPLPPDLAAPDIPAFARDSPAAANRSGTLVIVIALAAILGAAAGYWFYQHMSPTSVQLAVEPQGDEIVVSWPSEQTNNVAHAAIRVNDATPIELPPDAKASGRWKIKAMSDNVKVELAVEHTFSKSIGIIRYIQPAGDR